jgi:peptidoglycan/xylan/chitin deacetylase (PgdA/CDA1 family)
MDSEITIVLYHHISSDADRLTHQLDLSTTPEVFEQHVRYFAKNFDFVRPADLFSGVLPRKALLITFDDAYKSVLDVGGPILSGVNAPSLFFLNPATIMKDTLPIDNALSFAVEEIGLPKVLSLMNVKNSGLTSTRELISSILPEMKLAEVKAAKQRILSELGTTDKEMRDQSKLFLTTEDLEEFSCYRIEVGNHSMEHTFFRALSDAELEREIAESRLALQRLSGQRVRCLSVPYGNENDATESALSIARASGHHAIFLVHARSNRFRPAKDIYYRISLRNTSRDDLSLKLRVMPALRSVRNWLW